MEPENRQSSDPAAAMRTLRRRMLEASPVELGIERSNQCRVFGVLMDWPVDDLTVSVVALSDGNASLYTTSTFGVIGGYAHSPVRRAATDFVRDTERFHSDAKPTADHSYPPADRVRFYLLTFDGLRVLEDDRAAVEGSRSRYSTLFGRGQDVITELRLIADKPKRS
jgi:hypothetical protein